MPRWRLHGHATRDNLHLFAHSMNYIQLEASYCLPIFIRLRSETEKGVKYIDLAQPALRRLKQNLRLYVLPVFTS